MTSVAPLGYHIKRNPQHDRLSPRGSPACPPAWPAAPPARHAPHPHPPPLQPLPRPPPWRRRRRLLGGRDREHHEGQRILNTGDAALSRPGHLLQLDQPGTAPGQGRRTKQADRAAGRGHSPWERPLKSYFACSAGCASQSGSGSRRSSGLSSVLPTHQPSLNTICAGGQAGGMGRGVGQRGWVGGWEWGMRKQAGQDAAPEHPLHCCCSFWH